MQYGYALAAAVELSLTDSSVKIRLAAVHGLTPVGSVPWCRHELNTKTAGNNPGCCICWTPQPLLSLRLLMEMNA
ncbi:hypothetical protein ACPV3A_23585 [Paenibacillus sp. Dod16]|uniref:hypothetical protein n=1 Tax=Paenibacillus sp. Dod16 TaxID=3416392 RepID=UPI003CF9FC6F